MIKEFVNWNSLILSNLTEIFSEPHAFMLSEVAARRRCLIPCEKMKAYYDRIRADPVKNKARKDKNKL